MSHSVSSSSTALRLFCHGRFFKRLSRLIGSAGKVGVSCYMWWTIINSVCWLDGDKPSFLSVNLHWLSLTRRRTWYDLWSFVITWSRVTTEIHLFFHRTLTWRPGSGLLSKSRRFESQLCCCILGKNQKWFCWRQRTNKMVDFSTDSVPYHNIVIMIWWFFLIDYCCLLTSSAFTLS